MLESLDWFKLAQAGFFIAMLVFIWPRAQQMWRQSPKGSTQDWMTYAALMCGVILFILFLISMVRS